MSASTVASPSPVDRGGSDWAIFVGCAAAAVCVTFSSIHEFQSSDTVMFSLVSLVKWTPYYWGQNRYGMLLPLLATPIREPIANLLAQFGALTFAWLAAPVVLARYLMPRGGWAAVGALTAVPLLCLLQPWYQHLMIVNPYPLSICLGLTGLIVLEKRSAVRWFFSVTAVAVGVWVNSGLFLFMAPLIFWKVVTGPRPLPRGRWRLWSPLVMVLVVNLVAVSIAGRHKTEEMMVIGLSTPWMSQWWVGWRALAKGLWRDVSWKFWASWPAAVIAGLLKVAFGRPGPNRIPRLEIRRASIVVLACLMYAMATGTLIYVEGAEYSSRYWQPVLQFLPVALWLPFVGNAVRKRTTLATPVAVAVAALVGFGWPRFQQPKEILSQRLGTRVPGLIELGCTHLAGEYWTTWSSVFMEHQARYERGESRRLFGVSLRSSDTQSLWESLDSAVVCAFVGDREILYRLSQLRPVHWEQVRQRDGIAVLARMP